MSPFRPHLFCQMYSLSPKFIRVKICPPFLPYLCPIPLNFVGLNPNLVGVMFMCSPPVLLILCLVLLSE